VSLAQTKRLASWPKVDKLSLLSNSLRQAASPALKDWMSSTSDLPNGSAPPSNAGRGNFMGPFHGTSDALVPGTGCPSCNVAKLMIYNTL
jgi:hypothetical protein